MKYLSYHISIIDTARIKDNWSKNFLQVKELITFDRSVMTYRIMNRLCPENLCNKFQRRINLLQRFSGHSLFMILYVMTDPSNVISSLTCKKFSEISLF